MKKPIDLTVRVLVDNYPEDWVRFVDKIEPKSIRKLDTSSAALSVQPDEVFEVTPIEGEPYILHLEIQARYDPDISLRMAMYAVLLIRAYSMPVHSVLLLMRSEAERDRLSGDKTWLGAYGSSLSVCYTVMRAWELEPDALRVGGMGTLPLLALAVRKDDLPSVIQFMRQRAQELRGQDQNEFWTSVGIFLGLRMPANEASQLLLGVANMRESSMYQAILEEGRQEGRHEGRQEGHQEGHQEGELLATRGLLLSLGTHRWGDPPPEIAQRLQANENIEELRRLATRVVDAGGWDELLD